MRRERLARRSLVAAALLVLAVFPALAQAPAEDGPPEILPASPYPLRGEPTELTVAAADGRPLPGVSVRALYRPNSETAHTEELGTTGDDGRLAWTPADAGVVTLATHGDAGAVAQARVSVRYGSFPLLGLLVMLAAALLLFGGAAIGFAWLLRKPQAAPAEEPPST